MKYKVLALGVLAGIIYSCASKKSSVPTEEAKNVPITEVKKVELTPELAEGKMLYENNCAKCHSLYETNEFSAEKWKPIIARMQKKARLDDIQGQKIYNYVTMQ